MSWEIAAWVAAAVLVAVGFAGTVLPALPGSGFVLAGLVLVAWVDDFTRVGGGTIAILVILAASTYGVDLLASALGAKRVGASRSAIVGAVLGAVVGLFFGIPGVLLGPFVGAVLGELIARRDLGQAGRAGFGTWLGMLLGAAAKLALVLSMLGVFAVAYLR